MEYIIFAVIAWVIGQLIFNKYLKKSEGYEGERKHNKKHGKGTYKWINGDKYEGDWIEDLQHGQGIFTWSNGDKYEGDWFEDQKHG